MPRSSRYVHSIATQALALLLVFAAPLLYAQCLAPEIGSAHFNKGEFAKLISSQPPSSSLAARIELAKAYQYSGLYAEALTILAEQTENTCEQAWLLGARIEVLQAQRQKTAVELQALAKLTQDAPILQAYQALLEGHAARVAMRYQAANESYQQALSLFGQTDLAPAHLYVVETQLAQAQNQFFLHAFAAVDSNSLKQAFTQAVTAVHTLPESFQKTTALLALGRLALEALAQNPDFKTKAHEVLEAAKNSAQKLQQTQLLSFAYGYLARLHQTQKAVGFNQQALFYAQQVGDPWLLYQWHHQQARLYVGLNQGDAALQHYQQAIHYLKDEVVREQLLDDPYLQLQGGFRKVVGAAYFELIELLLAQGKTVSQAQLKDIISTLESFKTTELNDYYQSPCFSLQQRCTEATAYLDAQTRLLYPVILADKLVLLLLDKAHISMVSVPVSEPRLRAQLARFLRLLGRHPFPEQLRRSRAERQQQSTQTACALTANYPIAEISKTLMGLSQQLYDWLLRPLAPHLSGVETLVIAAEGPLRHLPFAALHDGKQFNPYAVGYLPMFCLSATTQQINNNKQMVLGGLSEAIADFPALPCVKYEIEQLQKLYQSPPALLNKDFIRPQLEIKLKQQTGAIVHLASHGQFGAKAENTFLLTYQERLNMNQLSRLLRSNLKEPIELLTLSACETALGSDRAALGLAGTVLKSGAISSLASLWQVDDVATPSVLLEFYRHYQNTGISKVQALHKAQQAMLTEEKYRHYRHPYFWSAFVLLGDWR